MELKDNERYYTVKEIGAMLQIKNTTLYRLVNQKDFPKIRMGKKKILIPKTDFDKFISKWKNDPKGYPF